MKTSNRIQQYKIAEWLGVKPGTLSNIFCGNRRPHRDEAVRLSNLSGVSFTDWMLSDCKQLKKKVFIAYTIAHERKQ